MICVYCKKEINDKFSFCPNCGKATCIKEETTTDAVKDCREEAKTEATEITAASPSEGKQDTFNETAYTSVTAPEPIPASAKRKTYSEWFDHIAACSRNSLKGPEALFAIICIPVFALLAWLFADKFDSLLEKIGQKLFGKLYRHDIAERVKKEESQIEQAEREANLRANDPASYAKLLKQKRVNCLIRWVSLILVIADVYGVCVFWIFLLNFATVISEMRSLFELVISIAVFCIHPFTIWWYYRVKRYCKVYKAKIGYVILSFVPLVGQIFMHLSIKDECVWNSNE